MSRIIKFIFVFVLLMLQSQCFAVEVTSPFGWRIHPIAGVERFHTGVDLGYAQGDYVQAMLPGRVVFAGVWGGYGNCVILEHTNGDHTLYGHMQTIYVAEGQTVGLHEVIGLVGSTGYSTGPHLHLEWWHLGSYVDPLPLFTISPLEAYAYAPPQYDAPIQAVMASDTGGEVEGFGFGFDKPKEDSERINALADSNKKKEKTRVKKGQAPTDYTKEQMEQMRRAVMAEAVAEAKRQLKIEEEKKKERVFFKLGFDEK